MRQYFIQVISLLFLFFSSNIYSQETLSIAVASNFLKPLKFIKQKFKADMGVELNLSSGSTGKLYSQLVNGAPYDVLLAADEKTPSGLVELRLAEKADVFLYARGKLVLAGRKASGKDELVKMINLMSFHKIAIANAKTAPYGRAAIEYLNGQKRYPDVKRRLVLGENVGQVFQFVYSGSVDLGLVALSQIKSVKNPPVHFVIPETEYSPILQSGAILKNSKKKTLARKFVGFLLHQNQQDLLHIKFGYTRVK